MSALLQRLRALAEAARESGFNRSLHSALDPATVLALLDVAEAAEATREMETGQRTGRGWLIEHRTRQQRLDDALRRLATQERS